MEDLIVFDLDNTLTISKSVIDNEMSSIFSKLLEKKKVAVISGGGLKEVNRELILNLNDNSNFNNLHIFPTDGTCYYKWNNASKSWTEVYKEKLTDEQKEKIFKAFDLVLNEINFDKKNSFGEIIEDRDSSVSFSALGQQAPINLKEKWDIDKSKRTIIRDKLIKIIPEFEIHIAGTTSIDITAKGLDKAYGIKKMEQYIKIPIKNMIFVGDSLYNGGNDTPVMKTGIRVISVKNPEETKKFIKDIIK